MFRSINPKHWPPSLRRPSARFKLLLALLLGWDPPPADPPQDPFAGVREPRKGGPGGRESAVALLEPEPDQFTEAVGCGK